MNKIENINMREIANFDNINYLIIDLRKEAAFKKFHIKNAVNIPYESILNREIEIPNGKTLILYCEHGGVSIIAAKVLLKRGYKVINTIGGVTAYKKQMNL